MVNRLAVRARADWPVEPDSRVLRRNRRCAHIVSCHCIGGAGVDHAYDYRGHSGRRRGPPSGGSALAGCTVDRDRVGADASGSRVHWCLGLYAGQLFLMRSHGLGTPVESRPFPRVTSWMPDECNHQSLNRRPGIRSIQRCRRGDTTAAARSHHVDAGADQQRDSTPRERIRRVAPHKEAGDRGE